MPPLSPSENSSGLYGTRYAAPRDFAHSRTVSQPQTSCSPIEGRLDEELRERGTATPGRRGASRGGSHGRSRAGEGSHSPGAASLRPSLGGVGAGCGVRSGALFARDRGSGRGEGGGGGRTFKGGRRPSSPLEPRRACEQRGAALPVVFTRSAQSPESQPPASAAGSSYSRSGGGREGRPGSAGDEAALLPRVPSAQATSSPVSAAVSGGVSEAGASDFEEVHLNTEGLTHRYSWPGGSPEAAAAFPDFSLPPSQAEYREVVETLSAGKLRLSLPFSNLEMWRYVLTGAAAATGPQRAWGEELHPERDVGSRQDVRFLLNRLHDQLAAVSANHKQRLQATQPMATFQRPENGSQGNWWEETQQLPDNSDYHYIREQIQAYSSCMFELCMQVSTQCAERGRLVGFCWHKVCSMFEAVLLELASLHRTVTQVDALKAELHERFEFSQRDVKRQFDLLRDNYKDLQNRHGALQMELGAVQEERDELRRKAAALEQLEDLESQLFHTEQALKAAQEHGEQLSLMTDRYKQLNQELERQVAASEGKLAQQAASVDKLESRMRQMTPRLPREFHIASSSGDQAPNPYALTSEHQAIVDHALVSGIAQSTMVTLFCEQCMCRYLKYFGMLARESHLAALSRERLVQVFASGDLSELEPLLTDHQLAAVVDMLHHGLAVDLAATVLTGRTSNGDDVKPLLPMVGLFPVEAAPALAQMLKVAARTNAERFQELAADASALRAALHAANKQVAILQEDLEVAARRTAEAQIKAGQPITPLEKLLSQRDEPLVMALGTAPNIPAFLRAKGKVKNRMLSKAETERMLKEILVSKKKEDKAKKVASTLSEFMGPWLARRFPREGDATEVAYSLVRALARYKADADCEMFLAALTGAVGEEVLAAQAQLVDQLQEHLELQDAHAFGKKPSGYISQQAVPDVLRSFFPTKTEQRLQELVELLRSHQEDGMVAYKPLFLEDEDFNQSDFIEAVRDQYTEERVEYLTMLEGAMYEHADEERQINQTGASRALMQIDPKINKVTMKAYLGRMFKNIKPASATQDVGMCISRLRRGVVRLSDGKSAKL